MNETDGSNSRREVVTGATALAALSMASVASRSAEAHEINAVHPTAEDVEAQEVSPSRRRSAACRAL